MTHLNFEIRAEKAHRILFVFLFFLKTVRGVMIDQKWPLSTFPILCYSFFKKRAIPCRFLTPDTFLHTSHKEIMGNHESEFSISTNHFTTSLWKTAIYIYIYYISLISTPGRLLIRMGQLCTHPVKSQIVWLDCQKSRSSCKITFLLQGFSKPSWCGCDDGMHLWPWVHPSSPKEHSELVCANIEVGTWATP